MAQKQAKDYLRQALLIGLGVMDLTATKAGEIVKAVKKDMNKEESKKAVNDFMASFEKNRAQIGKTIKEQLKKAVKELGLVTRDELKNYKSKK